MLALVPRPVKAVVLLYPIDKEGDAKSKEEDERLQLEGQPKIDDTIFWVKQKVGLSSFCGRYVVNGGISDPKCMRYNWANPRHCKCNRYPSMLLYLPDTYRLNAVRCNV